MYTYAELFSGPGGMSLGAKLTKKINPVFALDHDKESCETYRHNIGGHIVCGDIHTYDLQKIPKHDILGFGFPCNDYSLVGEQKGLNGKYGPLYSYAVSVLKSHQPLAFVAENVDGLTGNDKGDAMNKILEDMSNAGYDLFPHLYHLENYQVPQTRHRIIIVGLRTDLCGFFTPPAPNEKLITAREAIENPPIPNDAFNNERTRQSAKVIERLQHTPPGKNAWCQEIPERLRLKCALKISSIYRRLDPDKPAYTITAGGGGGTHTYHWLEPRALTNRERARLQTFPDNFEFKGGKESIRSQIGMAVPPVAAKMIFEALLKSLCQKSTRNIYRKNNRWVTAPR